jgi:hypothetical protein
MDRRAGAGFLRLICGLKFLLLLTALATVLSVVTLCDAVGELDWQAFSVGRTTPDEVILLFGPPAIIKTEERYSDWVKSQALGCGQLRTYAMNYSTLTGDLNILKGPLGKASAADVIIDKGKVSEVVWTYDNNQLEPALRQWLNHKGLTPTVGKKPAMIMIGTWNPKKGTLMAATCYNGGEGPICRGPITVHYLAETENEAHNNAFKPTADDGPSLCQAVSRGGGLTQSLCGIRRWTVSSNLTRAGGSHGRALNGS